MSLDIILEKHFLDDIKITADKYIIDDRGKFNDMFDVVINYTKKSSSILVSDVNSLIGEPEVKEKIILYSYDPILDGKKITDLIFKLRDSPISKFTQMKTVIVGSVYMINYKFRVICEIHKLNHFSNKKVTNLSPEIINGIKYLPSEIELIIIYNKLYSLYEVDNVEKNKYLESKLYNIVKKRYSDGIFGGRSVSVTDINIIKKDIVLNYLVGNPDIVLIGDWAVKYKNHDTEAISESKISIICGTDSKIILKQLNNLMNGKYKFSMFKHSSHIPSDNVMEIHTIYIVLNKLKINLLTIYNESAYNIIPAINYKDINIGTKWVLLRFLFIDFWTIRVIYYNNFINKKTYTYQLNLLWETITTVHNSIDDIVGIDSDSDTKKQDIKFIGKYISVTSINKIKNTKMETPYYPYLKIKK